MGYWDFYNHPRARAAKNGIKLKNMRGDIGDTWWSRRWVEALESFTDGNRLVRGRSYARKGQVVSVEISACAVSAKVQGSRPKPYNVSIKLKPLSDREWDAALGAMASQAIFAAKLLSGEMPKSIEDAFRKAETNIFPSSEKDIETDCSCPDWENPCKHVAAAHYILAERFDENPFLIFEMRGRTKERIIGELRKRRGAVPQKEYPKHESAAPKAGHLKSPQDFWRAGKGLKTFSIHIAAPEVDNAVLKRLGPAPFYVEKANIAAILSKVYGAVTEAALKKAFRKSKDAGEE